MGEKFPRILPKVATSTSLLGSFTCRKFTTWDQQLYFPSEGRRAEDFFARKIRQLRLGLNPRTRVPKASTLTSRPPKPLKLDIMLMLIKNGYHSFRHRYVMLYHLRMTASNICCLRLCSLFHPENGYIFWPKRVRAVNNKYCATNGR